MYGPMTMRARTVRTWILVVGGAAVATVGVVFGPEGREAVADRADDPMHAYYRGHVPRFPGAHEFPLGTDMQLGEEPIHMSYFFTDATPARVADYYRTMWQLAGLRVSDDVTPRGGYVGTYDVEAGL